MGTHLIDHPHESPRNIAAIPAVKLLAVQRS